MRSGLPIDEVATQARCLSEWADVKAAVNGRQMRPRHHWAGVPKLSPLFENEGDGTGFARIEMA